MIAALVVALVFLAAVLTITLSSRNALISFLIGASAGLVAVQFFQVHLFAYLVLAWAIFSRRDAKSLLPWQAALPIVCAIPLASTALTGDLVNSPTLALQLLAFAICAALIVITATSADIKQMLIGLMATSSAASAWGILQVVGIVPNDAWHIDVSALGRPTGFYPEPDWLGMFAGIGLVLAWRVQLGPKLRVILVLINSFAFVLAFARAAWVAVAASAALALVLYIVQRRRGSSEIVVRKTATGRRSAVLILLVAGTAVLVSVPSLAADLTVRLSRTLTVADNDISGRARVQQNDSLSYLASTAPWNGHGISTSGRVGVSGIIDYGDSPNNLGSNWLTSMWVDGAALSLPLIGFLVITAILAARSIQGQLLVLVLLNSLFSNATFQPVTWLLVGLCLASLRIHGESKDLRSSPVKADSVLLRQ